MAEIKNPEINIRVKEFRQLINLTQGQFAEAIGIKQSSLSSIENISVNVSERVIRDICLSFNVNETWLRTGEGEMYIQTDDTLFTKLSKEYNLSVGMQELLRAILDLDDERREQLVNFAVYFNSRLAPAIETSSTVLPESATNKIDKELANYRRELEAEEKGRLALQNLGAEKKA